MQRIKTTERPHWRDQAREMGFVYADWDDGTGYWNEKAYYQFTLRQIEDDLEDPTEEIEQMCRAFVDVAVRDEEILRKLALPEYAWDMIANSWLDGDKDLYGRIDLCYDGKSPAKLYEYNADTPTSLYEAALFQWVWLEDCIASGRFPDNADQFNSAHERMVERLKAFLPLGETLYGACAKDSTEDAATITYIQDLAEQAGLKSAFIHVEDIGIDAGGQFTDMDDNAIRLLFKLYPWEWMLDEEFGGLVPKSDTVFIEPPWKAVLSNKGMLPYLWAMNKGHPNLLPAFFAGDSTASELGDSYALKPIFSREGANVKLVRDGVEQAAIDGPYGEEGMIVQALAPLPEFDGQYPVIGSWIVDGQAAGMGIREDTSIITMDESFFLPHVIID